MHLDETKTSAINIGAEELMIMKQYEWILFDADETLFHFDSFQGLQRMFSKFSYDFTNDDFVEYESINKPLWVDYQNGLINAQQLQQTRFKNWANKLQTSSEELNASFLTSMAEICAPVDGAEQLLTSIKGKAKLGVVTNGFVQLQRLRLEKTGLLHFFDLLVISEEVGVAKPDRRIFDHALTAMGNPRADKVLMVGDNPHSDIQGGINVGIDTCWINRTSKPTPAGIEPSYLLPSLVDLQRMLLDSFNNIVR